MRSARSRRQAATATRRATYDTIAYEVSNPEVARVEDEDHEPLDCEITLLALGTSDSKCTVDTRKGDEVVTLVLLAQARLCRCLRARR